MRVPDKFIFMKVGQHAGEDFEKILFRKKKEFADAGMIFWGYGGNTLHPVHHVQPFIKTFNANGNIYLLMQPIKSNADPDIIPAKEYSSDLMNWQKIPRGISVTGSRYALILADIEEKDLEVNLNNFQVGAGKSFGKLANEYVKGHVDKGCFISSEIPNPESKPIIKNIKYIAKLKSPYAVFLR